MSRKKCKKPLEFNKEIDGWEHKCLLETFNDHSERHDELKGFDGEQNHIPDTFGSLNKGALPPCHVLWG